MPLPEDLYPSLHRQCKWLAQVVYCAVRVPAAGFGVQLEPQPWVFLCVMHALT